MFNVQLVNPNTSVATTALMLDLARASAPPTMRISGLTAQHGPNLIVDAAGLAIASDAVAALQNELTGDGIIVAAFGDPGVAALRRALSVPVIGIGEAAVRAAQTSVDQPSGRRFSIVTTTPKLELPIRAYVATLGGTDNLASVRITAGDPAVLTSDAGRLEAELLALVERAVTEDGAQAVIIGGGPLAGAARSIARRVRIEIIEPIPAAVAWMARLLHSN